MIRNFNNKLATYITIIIIVSFIYSLDYLYNNYYVGPEDITIKQIDEQVVITYSGEDECYVIASKEEPSIDDVNFKKMAGNSYSFNSSCDPTNYYIKYGSKVYFVGSSEELDCLSLIDDIDKYLILGEEYDFSKYLIINNDSSGQIEYSSSNEDILSIDNGIIKTNNTGKVTVSATLENCTKTFEFTVTDLIQKMPEEFDVNKELLECGRYTEEENDLLDEILEYRINQAGYQTRGAVVATTRFLLLEFPYRLTYFYEYGRQTYNNVDGEGRYYIKGLYLDESRFSGLIGSNTGPATWGCPLYSVVLSIEDINGLDCSGFVTWALLNSGFDCGEIGSGFSEYYDLTETGELVKNSLSIIKDIKAGDLVHSDYMGGHIGIVAGITDSNVYIAQATPKNNWGVTITKYEYEDFIVDWDEIVFMDSYYQQEGNYTNMW